MHSSKLILNPSAYRAPIGRTGVTLIEILIVVALMAIAATLLIPNMQNVTTFETEAAVRQIANDIIFAQSDAVANQAGRRVVFEEDGSGYRLLGAPYDYDNDVIWDPVSYNGTNKYIVNFQSDLRYKNVEIESAVFDANLSSITFDSLGGPVNEGNGPSTGGTVVIVGNDERFELHVTAFTGRVSVEKIIE